MKISPKQIASIFHSLRQHLRQDEQGLKYDAGWSDSAVANEAGVTVMQVKQIRRESFGELPARGKAPKVGSIAHRVKVLEQQMAALMSEYPLPEASDERVHASFANHG